MSEKVAFVKVEEKDAPCRLDRWFKRYYPMLSHGALEKLLRGKNIRVNGIKATADLRLQTGDEIRVPPMPQVSPKIERALSPNDIQFIQSLVIYKDKNIIVLNKPAGLAVQGGSKTFRHIDGLSEGLKFGAEKPKLVHRLDKDTSGLILIAKNDKAHVHLSEQFKERTMEKHYRAVAYGSFKENSGMIDAPIARHPVDRKRMAIVPGGKPSQTEWCVLEELYGASYLDVHLLTGRTHQIRVHMHSVGHPLMGDSIYSPNIKHPVHIPRLMLHAYHLSFTHPTSQERMTIHAPLPAEFERTLEKLRKAAH